MAEFAIGYGLAAVFMLTVRLVHWRKAYCRLLTFLCWLFRIRGGE